MSNMDMRPRNPGEGPGGFEFDRTMKAAVGDDEVWNRVKADPIMASMAAPWLLDREKHIDAQCARRRGEFDEWAAGGHRPDYRARYAEYRKWMSSANRFKDMCVARRRELKAAGVVDGQVERARVRSALKSEQTKVAIAAFRRLAYAILQFEQGNLSADDLCATLDTVVMAWGDDLDANTARKHAGHHQNKLTELDIRTGFPKGDS